MAQTSKEFLIDTNILVDYLRFYPKAQEFLDSLRWRYISIISAMEIIQGSRNKRELEIELSFLHNFKVINIDNKISDLALDLMKNYKLKFNLLIPDAFIAATALSRDKILITKNIKDFKFIKGLKFRPPY